VGGPAGLGPVAVGGVLGVDMPTVPGPPKARPARARSNNPAGTRSNRLGAVGRPHLAGGPAAVTVVRGMRSVWARSFATAGTVPGGAVLVRWGIPTGGAAGARRISAAVAGSTDVICREII
jgi:hypothetical protein